jgi:hypothetical protein
VGGTWGIRFGPELCGPNHFSLSVTDAPVLILRSPFLFHADGPRSAKLLGKPSDQYCQSRSAEKFPHALHFVSSVCPAAVPRGAGLTERVRRPLSTRTQKLQTDAPTGLETVGIDLFRFAS